jgi:hypothetical protein
VSAALPPLLRAVLAELADQARMGDDHAHLPG